MAHRNAALPLLGVGLCLLAATPRRSEAGAQAPEPAGAGMEKHVSKGANFVLYKPRGWAVHEGEQPGFRTLAVVDPQGRYEAAMFFGKNPAGNDVLALTKRFVGGIGGQFPDLSLERTMVSQDRTAVTFDALFTAPQKGKRAFRCWVTGRGDEFVYSSIETPAGELAAMRPLLLTILSNVRVMQGALAVGGPPPVQVRFVDYRLRDGSASFKLPQGWRCQDFGKGSFIASDPGGAFGFIVGAVDVISPRLGVSFPGAIISPYLAPHRAWEFLTAKMGMARNMRFEKVIPRQDIAQQMATVYTAGAVAVEEFFYTYDGQKGKAKGYSLGFSLGTRLGTNWSFRHCSVLGPLGEFNAFLPHYITMLDSYRINQAWAAGYVAHGMARLRELQQQTSQMVARNAQEIRQMMQAAYDERQRSMDYIDYQRSNTIRGQQDWISGLEGGTVYHTDSWGTKNTTTGEYWEGKAYDHVRFKGENPKYREQMQAVDSRELWERHIK